LPKHPAALAVLFALAACAASPPGAEAVPGEGSVRRVPLAELAMPRRLPDGAQLTGAWELRSVLPITGLSAMALSGERLRMATDQGDLFETNCPAGRPLDDCASTWRFDGRLIARGAPRADIEALAIRPDGSVVLGLENLPRLALLEGDGEGGHRIGRLEGAPDLRFLPRNSGPEAMTSLPDGRLVVLPEGGVDGENRALVMVQDAAGGWRHSRLDLPDTGLLPVEAAAAGDHLFVLLRGFGIFAGWQGRILALPLGALDEPGAVLPAPALIATLDDPKIADNHEAMTARQLPDGSYSLLVASDDNGFALQRKLLLALTWKPEQAPRAQAPSGS
jgi:hypothetical protein